VASMDGTGDATIAIGVGTARAAMALPFGSLAPGSWAIELCWWAGSLLAFAAMAHSVTKWWRCYGGRALLLSLPIQRWPDFVKWDDRTEFELHEAAALWFDAEPRLPMWWRARRKFRQWERMIAGGIIPAHPGLRELGFATTSSITPHIRIQRAALRALAEKEGSKPLFLFPDRRV
jgi:hypothetical protein